MKKIILLLFLFITVLLACNEEADQQNQHVEPTHNFTVNRVLILNEENKLLVEKEAGNWYPPAYIYNKRQYITEGIDSLTNELGIKTSKPKLQGYFSYKYEYHPYSTLRGYFVVKHISGTPKPVGKMVDLKWMPIEEAISKIPVESIKMGVQQILEHPDTLWGGSFYVYRKGEHHHARIVEDFYPLFD